MRDILDQLRLERCIALLLMAIVLAFYTVLAVTTPAFRAASTGVTVHQDSATP